MIKHQSLTSDEMVTLSYLAQASYSDSPDLSLNAKTSKWEAITSELTSYGLSQSALVGNSYNKVGQYGYGDANAVLFRNNATNELAIGFRGTEVPKGDPLFWLAIGNHYSLFTEFIQSCEKYIADKNPSKVQITGHSLGGAMAERFMEQFQDGKYACVAFASPEASRNGGDTRTLNIGHDNDIVYSISITESTGANALIDTSVLVGPANNDPAMPDLVEPHSMNHYIYTATRLMNTNITEIQLGDLVGIDRTDDSTAIAAHFDKFDPIDFHFGTSFILGEDKADDLDFSKLYGIPLLKTSKQVVEGAGGNDTINGGAGTDTAVYSDKFENYKIVKSGSSITIEHVAGTMADGKDTLTDVEVARFADRTVSLPLKDGPTMVKKEALLNDSGAQVGVGAVSMPTFMLDGDVDFQVTLSSSGVTKKYNFAFIIDVSGSMAGQPLAQAKQAYINLIDHLKSIGVAANSTFAVIPFSSSATLHGSLSADQASSLINTLTDLGGTNYRAGLEQANTYFNQTSSYNVTNVAYFLSDGEPDYGNAYQTAAQSLQTLADVRAFGIGNANLAPLNTVDSGNAELLKDSKDLGSAFVAAGLRKTDIAGLEVWLNGALVQRISPDQLTEDTLGLSYSGSLSGLSVAADAKNDISVRVVMADGKSTTTSIDPVVSVGDGSRASASSSGFDLDGDGHADAVLQSGNRFALWTLDDTDLKSGKIFKTVSDSNWRLQGAGDFSGDGKGDLLLKHDDGRIAVWTMNGEQITDGKVIKTLADNKWAIASTGDYDGDAVSDVMLKHQDGRVALWSMNNSDLSKGAVIKTLSDPNWKIAGTGDFDGNGRDEVLLQHTNGNVATWSLDGHQLKSGAIVQAFQGAGWSVEGTGDFNGDASDDILLKNQDGRLSVWEMRLGKVAKSYDLDQLKDTSWQVANVADFNGDGRADVMFQHSDGRVATWLLDGSSRLHGGITNTLKDTSWSVLGNSRLV